MQGGTGRRRQHAESVRSNLGEAFLGIRRGENNLWRAALRLTADGPEVAATEPEFDNPTDAWEAAFELYRTTVIV